MTIDKFGRHILQHHIKSYIPKKTYQAVLYIHGKEKGSQKFQKPLYTFILQNNSVVYTVPIKEGVIENIVSYPKDIFYHYNKSGQTPLKYLVGKRVFKGDTFVFDSIKHKTEDQLFIEITVNCEQ